MVEIRKAFRNLSPPFSYLIKLYSLILRQDRKREIRGHKKQTGAIQPEEKQESQHSKVFLSPVINLQFSRTPTRNPSTRKMCNLGGPCESSLVSLYQIIIPSNNTRAPLESH